MATTTTATVAVVWLSFTTILPQHGIVAFSPHHHHHDRNSFKSSNHPYPQKSTFVPSLLSSSSGSNDDTTHNMDNTGLIYDDIPSEFEPLFRTASETTLPRSADNTDMGHDAFRFEWGTWVNEETLESLMDRVNEVRLNQGIYDKFMQDNYGHDYETNNNKKVEPLRYRVAGGQDWDCILHILPPDKQWMGRWPTGSWAIVKTLTGMCECAMLRGPNRDGIYRKSTTKDLRGGGDGTLGGGQSSAGADCIKYVGGPLRSYAGKSGKTVLLEVIIRPPISVDESMQDELTIEPLPGDIGDTLSIYIPEPEPEESEEEEEETKAEEEKNAGDGESEEDQSLGSKLGMTFEKVGGLDDQLDAIARRVLASRANPEAARRLGVSHVRGILLSGPPGCGKTLLARELARILGAREPQIVNGPEILDKFIGEAEKKVRELFAPAEAEYAQVGDDSALHIIILDEMDAIARKRGTMTADTTGVRDSVVNQLLAKMDGVKEANNVLVVGLTNRPELLDPALLRPGRLEVQLRVELPDLLGRRDILKIHTRQMKEAGALSPEAESALTDVGEHGIPARAEHYSGAELAGLVRSAASFALARTVEEGEDAGLVMLSDLDRALREVRPALGKQDEVLKLRYPLGISPCSSSMQRIMRDLKRFTAPVPSSKANSRLQSLLLVGAGNNGGAGSTALAAWAAAEASVNGSADYVRFVTALDLLSGEGGGSGGEAARAAALVDRFSEAREMSSSLLVLDDIDQICSGSGPGGYSSVMLSTLRALLRTPPPTTSTAKAGGHSQNRNKSAGGGAGKSIQILAATSRSDAACVTLHELFDETIVVPLLSDTDSVQKLLSDGLTTTISRKTVESMASMIINRLGKVGCKTALRLAERAVASAGIHAMSEGDIGNEAALAKAQLDALAEILEDLVGDEATAEKMCEVF